MSKQIEMTQEAFDKLEKELMDMKALRPEIAQEIQEARRRRKLERQEKRVERLNEPLLVWLHKSFRVVTIAGTVVMAGLEVRNSMMVGAENMMQRVLFTALGAWLVFGLVWAGSAIGQMIVLHKAGQGGSKEFRSYRNSALVAIAGMILLGAAFAMT